MCCSARVPCQDMSRCGQLCASAKAVGRRWGSEVGGSVVSPAEGRDQSPGPAGSGPEVRQGLVSGLQQPRQCLERMVVVLGSIIFPLRGGAPVLPSSPCKNGGSACPSMVGKNPGTPFSLPESPEREWGTCPPGPTCLMAAGFLGPLSGELAAAEGVRVTNVLAPELGGRHASGIRAGGLGFQPPGETENCWGRGRDVRVLEEGTVSHGARVTWL